METLKDKTTKDKQASGVFQREESRQRIPAPQQRQTFGSMVQQRTETDRQRAQQHQATLHSLLTASVKTPPKADPTPYSHPSRSAQTFPGFTVMPASLDGVMKTFAPTVPTARHPWQSATAMPPTKQ